jgi:hypothetical protein
MRVAEKLDWKGLRHANRLKSWVGGYSMYGSQFIEGSNTVEVTDVCCECRVLSGAVSVSRRSFNLRSPTECGVSEFIVKPR